jgi:hypothetical protein
MRRLLVRLRDPELDDLRLAVRLELPFDLLLLDLPVELDFLLLLRRELLDFLLEPPLDFLLEPVLDFLLEPPLDFLLEPVLDFLLEPPLDFLLDPPLDDLPFAPPVRLFTVAQPIRSASFPLPPRSRTLSSMCSAILCCLPE